MNNLESKVYNKIFSILNLHPEGISEFELLKLLTKDKNSGFSEESFKNNYTLFQSHFLLFHTLYKMKNLYYPQKIDIEIHCLKIRLIQIPESNQNPLVSHNSLESYYLNLDNLSSTTEAEVDKMLEDFWKKFAMLDQRKEALSLLGLEDPIKMVDIEKRYRELLKIHHPDIGGDIQKMQEINTAMEVLRKIQ